MSQLVNKVTFHDYTKKEAYNRPKSVKSEPVSQKEIKTRTAHNFIYIIG